MDIKMTLESIIGAIFAGIGLGIIEACFMEPLKGWWKELRQENHAVWPYASFVACAGLFLMIMGINDMIFHYPLDHWKLPIVAIFAAMGLAVMCRELDRIKDKYSEAAE